MITDHFFSLLRVSNFLYKNKLSDKKTFLGRYIITNPIACIAGQFWLGAQSNKGRQGKRNHEEIGVGA